MTMGCSTDTGQDAAARYRSDSGRADASGDASEVDGVTDAKAFDARTDAVQPDAGVRDDGSRDAAFEKTADSAPALLPGAGGLVHIARLPIGKGAPVVASCARSSLLALGRAAAPGPTPELFFVRIGTRYEPTVVGALDVDTSIHAVVLEGTLAYAATSDDSRELLVIDVSNPSVPAVTGHFDAPGAADALSLDVAGNRVVLGRAEGPEAELEFLDVADPKAISELSSIDVGADVNDVETNASAAYVATSGPGKEIRVFHYGTTPRSWSFDAGRPARALDLAEQHLYVAVSDARGGEMLEFAAPWHETPAFVKSLTLPAAPADVARYGNRAVVTMPGAGIAVVGGLDAADFNTKVLVPEGADAGDGAVSDAGARTTPGTLEVEAFLKAPEARVLAFRGDAILVGGDTGVLDVVRSGLVPRVVNPKRGGSRTISILGDSNTKRPDNMATWADLLPGMLAATDYNFVNHAAPFAATWRVLNGIPSAADQLFEALASDEPDAVAAAFGTNDVTLIVTVLQGEPLKEEAAEPYVRNLLDVRATARERRLPLFVALTPPRNVLPDPSVQLTYELNHHLRSDIDPSMLIDFFSPMTIPDDYLDGLHIGSTGQQKRAEEASMTFAP
jgi:lysophospholipase L1-like esterase